jgi:hypothetical protein
LEVIVGGNLAPQRGQSVGDGLRIGSFNISDHENFADDSFIKQIPSLAPKNGWSVEARGR